MDSHDANRVFTSSVMGMLRLPEYINQVLVRSGLTWCSRRWTQREGDQAMQVELGENISFPSAPEFPLHGA